MRSFIKLERSCFRIEDYERKTIRHTEKHINRPALDESAVKPLFPTADNIFNTLNPSVLHYCPQSLNYYFTDVKIKRSKDTPCSASRL